MSVGLLALTLGRWFGGAPRWLPVWLPLLAGLGLLAWLTRPRWPVWLAWRPYPETLLCLAVAVAYRASALVHPWGWVNRDGAYAAFVALHLLDGQRPAPVFTEGANYQGTLKPHLAAALAALTGHDDLARLVAAAGLLLSLAWIAATMALARRLGGRAAAAAAGLYLAIGPRFATVFTLNAVGQYADVLALGGLALAVLARLLDEEAAGRAARGPYFGLGLLLGAAFWQQPVALAYVLAAGAALLLRRRTWRDPWALAAPLGMAVGVLPVLLWNAQHGWASGEILGREPEELRTQAGAVIDAVGLTARVSFPILAGLSPGHPWADAGVARGLAWLVIPGALALYVLLRRREVAAAIRGRGRATALLPLLLMAASLALFWAVAAGRVYLRPRYILPVVAATAIHAGVGLAALARRSRWLAAASLAPLLALHAAGFAPRLAEAAEAQRYWQGVVRALQGLGVRTGYADFSVAAPVTMFTSERILLSPRLGPTPAYYSPSQEARVAAQGPDAFVLRQRDDPAGFAAALRSLGVGFSEDRQTLPVFHGLTRRVALEEVLAAWGQPVPAGPAPE